MTNKFKTIIEAIETKLLAAGCKRVFRYPEDYGKIGNQYPFAVLKEGRQQYIATAGNRYEIDTFIIITLYGSYGTNRMERMQDLQVAVFNQLFPDAKLAGAVANINPVTVDPGEIMTGSDIFARAGHNEAVAMREIVIQTKHYDSRR